MKIKASSRKNTKLRALISGPSGSGKTYSSLMLAQGLVGNLDRVCVIDTENGSSNLYADMGDFSIIEISEPYFPLKYVDAIALAVDNGFECVIVDSATPEWNGSGGILQTVEQYQANSSNKFTAWNQATALHNKFVDSILHCKKHIIVTARSKTNYSVVEGKPQKMGLEPVQRDGFEYEFDIHFDIDQNNKFHVLKNRTRLFQGIVGQMIAPKHGETLAKWLAVPEIPAQLKTDMDEIAELIKENQIDIRNGLKSSYETLKAALAKNNWDLAADSVSAIRKYVDKTIAEK